MGTVFVARTGGISGIQKLCVIKTLRSHFAADTDYVLRFMDEARVVVALEHRNICRVSDVGHANGRYFMAMEYIRGTDLRAVWRRYADSGRPVPEPVALYLLSEALEALDYAHHLRDETTGLPLQLVHRDISPQNIMVGYQGEVKVIDFGLAASTLKLEKTAPQVVMGKVGYMSPEQARGDVVDHLTDQFAAGVVLYELLTGERYYEGMGPHQIWAVVGTGEYRPKKLGELPDDTRAIVERTLHPDKAQRFPSCSAFRQALLDVAYQRGYRVGGPEVREAMHQMFAAEVAQQRELVASFSRMDDILAESGPALAAAGRAEHEATQTATDYAGSGSSEPQDTGETKTEKVAPGELRVFDDDHAVEPRTRRPLIMAAGLAFVATLILSVVAALVMGNEPPAIPDGIGLPPPPLVAARTSADPDTDPDTDTTVPEDPPPEAAAAVDEGAKKGPAPSDAAPAAADREDDEKIADAAEVKKSTAAKGRRRSRSGRRLSNTSKRPTPKTKVIKPPPPAGEANQKAKLGYLEQYCPHLSCSKWLLNTKISGDTPNATLSKFRAKLPTCVAQCAKR
jgi:tRNA A-37 threonylcarbamoyl transferase component Bud32